MHCLKEAAVDGRISVRLAIKGFCLYFKEILYFLIFMSVSANTVSVCCGRNYIR